MWMSALNVTVGHGTVAKHFHLDWKLEVLRIGSIESTSCCRINYKTVFKITNPMKRIGHDF